MERDRCTKIYQPSPGDTRSRTASVSAQGKDLKIKILINRRS